MNLFDRLVAQALQNNPELSNLRVVVEKELLHHDILRILSQNNLLSELVFIGGTALRSCYGGIRLSEDLDFTGGLDFNRNSLVSMNKALKDSLQEKYGLNVNITEPTRDTTNVDTWKIKVETRPLQKNMPAQRINIDICSVTSYDKQPMLLLNPYGVDMGTNGLIIQTQSKAEIFTDKLLAFALRPNRIKNRDLWDMIWLHQQSSQPKIELIPNKLHDRKLNIKYFLEQFSIRTKLLSDDPQLSKDFVKEMQRFLPKEKIKELDNNNLWSFIIYLINDFNKKITRLC